MVILPYRNKFPYFRNNAPEGWKVTVCKYLYKLLSIYSFLHYRIQSDTVFHSGLTFVKHKWLVSMGKRDFSGNLYLTNYWH